MRGGFSFCGHDIADYNIHYAPENENTYVYKPAKANVHEETIDGHNGSYIYGATKEAKEFTLRCYYEDTRIDRGLMAKVHSLFRVGKSGNLIFKRRPWCAYYATVTSVDDSSMYSYLNGVITITMKAGYPFARGINEVEPFDNKHLFYNLPTNPHHGEVMLNTGLFNKEDMVPDMTFENIELQKPNKKVIYLPNPGTERASVGIVASGNSGTGVIIENITTNQTCKLVAMKKENTTDLDKEVFIDGLSGKTVLRGSSESTINFLYHDEGFIELEPAFPVIRNVFIQYTGTATIQLVNRLEEDVVGKFVFANKKWRKIIEQPSTKSIVVDDIDDLGSGSERTIISDMNEIHVYPASNMDLDRLSFVYKPTYS